MPEKIISYKLQYGAPVAIRPGVTLQPVSRAFALRLGQWVGLVWNRPVAVQVLGPGEKLQTLPVRDPTRRHQLLILGGALLIALVLRVSVAPAVAASMPRKVPVKCGFNR